MDNVTFDVDHLQLDRGLYLARTDLTGDVATYTFDLRTRRPYKEDVMTTQQMHTFEHAFATALRNVDSALKLIYFGPMGCATGYYILVQSLKEDYIDESGLFDDMVDLMDKAIAMAQAMDEVPAKAKIQCGNALTLGTVEDIRSVNREVIEILDNIKSKGNFDSYTYI